MHHRDHGQAADLARGHELASAKVLAISSYGVLGGSELALSEFVVHRPAGVEVEVLLLEDGPLRARLSRRAVPTWVGRDLAGRPSASTLVRFSRGLLRLLRDAAPDVVVAFGLKAAIMGVSACRLAGVPLVWYKVDFSLDDLVTRPLALAVNGVVSVSDAVAAELGRLRDRKLLAVVGPPCRLPRELHLTPTRQPPAIGTLGTLTPIKGHRHLIEAAGLLSEEFPDLRVLIAGLPASKHPGFAEELRALAESLGIGERLELPGFVDDVSKVLARLTVYVSATYRDEHGFGAEGLSGAMVEASWAGLPVVATRCGGSQEGLLNGVTGTLVDPADPPGLARAITPFLRDEELARRTGRAGSQLARVRFAPETVAAALFGALREVL